MWLTLIAGLVLVIFGAELILRGSSALALRMKIPPILIGLTVVAMGTSAPELAVGLSASAQGAGAMAVGNIAGTNIFNILLILGLSAFIRPLPLELQVLKLDLPVMTASALLLIALSLDGSLGRLDGAIFVGLAVVYTLVLIRRSLKEPPAVKEEFAHEYAPERFGRLSWLVHLGLLGVGLFMTVKGADVFVGGAVEVARAFGVSEAVIGLTVVALGTSAPELVTTLVGTFRNERDVAVGNLLGSSIYNILAILGLTSLLSARPLEVTDSLLYVDLPLAALVALVCIPVFRSGHRVSRLEGGFFVASFLTYILVLIFVRT